MFKKILTLSFLLVAIMILASLGNDLLAQCPMCRSAVESAMQQEGNTVGVGLNSGILYLLATPYIIVAVVGGFWYRNYRRNRV